MTAASTVGGDDRFRLFLALELPEDVSAELSQWAARHVAGGRVVRTHHVTLAFLGLQPASVLAPVVDLLTREASATGPLELAFARYRETGSVGMLVLTDDSGAATSLATRIQIGLEELGVYEREQRRWLPHVTVVRFRERPRLRPPLPETRTFVPSGAAALLSRLHPSGARYEVLESCPIGRRRRGWDDET